MTDILGMIDYDKLKEKFPEIDVALSVILNEIAAKASEATLAAVLSQLDITLTELRDAITAPSPDNKTLADLYDRLNSIRTQLDTTLSTRASETTLASILSQLDLTLTELRDAIRGTGDKTLTDLDASIAAIKNALSSIGTDKLLTTPDNPSNLDIALSALRDALKPTRALPVQELSSQSIAAGGTQEFTVSDGDGYSALVVTVKAAYNASATAGVRVRWLYSPDGTNFDSVEDAEAAGNYEDLSFAAGATRIRTILIPLFQPYVKVQIVNLDTSYAVTVDAWRTLMR